MIRDVKIWYTNTKTNEYTQVYYYTYTFIHPDIDECSEGTDNCTQICINTDGSFTCGCSSGYQLDTDGFTCSGKHKCVYNYDYHTYPCTSIHTYIHRYLLACLIYTY